MSALLLCALGSWSLKGEGSAYTKLFGARHRISTNRASADVRTGHVHHHRLMGSAVEVNHSAPCGEAACSRCRQASGGACKAEFRWSWTSSLAANDLQARLPGMRLVRGVDALSEPNVRVVARWNQSNWPGIISKLAPGLVRAANDDVRLRLCRLWQREHSYQSWPVLLGCPGRQPTEYEPPCSNVGVVVQIPCASIDLTSDPTTAGGIYDNSRWFRVTHSVHPPEVCRERQIGHVGDVGIAMSVYPTALGHFVPEQLPNVLLLHANLPADVPIIVADAPVVHRYLDPLIASGIVQAGRFQFEALRNEGKVLRARSVYTVLNSHFSNVMNGDVGYKVLRAAFSPNGPAPPSKRTNIVLIDRGVGKSRSVINAADVKATLIAGMDQYAARRAQSSSHHGATALQLINWKPNSKNVSADVEVFRHACMIVAPHGAGLSNMLFASEGTPIIEMCYDDHFNPNARGMFCPAMYAAMAANLHMPYWVTTADGSYTSSMRADIPQLSAAVTQAMEVIYAHTRAGSRHGGSGSAPAGEFGNVSAAASRASAASSSEDAAGGNTARASPILGLVRRLRRHTCAQ